MAAHTPGFLLYRLSTPARPSGQGVLARVLRMCTSYRRHIGRDFCHLIAAGRLGRVKRFVSALDKAVRPRIPGIEIVRRKRCRYAPADRDMSGHRRCGMRDVEIAYRLA